MYLWNISICETTFWDWHMFIFKLWTSFVVATFKCFVEIKNNGHDLKRGAIVQLISQLHTHNQVNGDTVIGQDWDEVWFDQQSIVLLLHS